MARITKLLAQSFIDRSKAQSTSGTVRDRYALEFMLGAAAFAAAKYGDKSPEWNEVSLAAFLVSTNGFRALNNMALQITKDEDNVAAPKETERSDPADAGNSSGKKATR